MRANDGGGDYERGCTDFVGEQEMMAGKEVYRISGCLAGPVLRGGQVSVLNF
jgi:hypothetical protein